MTKYRVEVAYATQKNRVVCGMDIDADGVDEAIDIAQSKVFKGYPARKRIYTQVIEDAP